MATAKDYLAQAAETLVQLKAATNEGERARLRRAHGVYLKLSTHGAEAAERAAMAPAPRIRPERPMAAPPSPGRNYFK
jgi:archaeosine-15-forming tRNA-guanine transglycosylase